MEILKSLLFGLVEGITEWLPVSSTGHMIILDQFVKLDVSPEFYKLYEVVIQLGAILAVVIIFWDKLWPFTMARKKSDASRTAVREVPAWKDGALALWINIIVACVPAAIVGIAFDDAIDALFYHPVPVAVALIVVGVLFIIIESTTGKKDPRITDLSSITIKTALIIGLFQTLAAIFPGTSRSGATILGALLIGVSREIAAEFTFFLAVPVMVGASLLKLLKYILSGVTASGMEILVLIVGCVSAFAVSMFVIRFLMNYIKNHDFKVFGWYRIGLGALVIILSISGLIAG